MRTYQKYPFTLFILILANRGTKIEKKNTDTVVLEYHTFARSSQVLTNDGRAGEQEWHVNPPKNCESFFRVGKCKYGLPKLVHFTWF